MKILLAIANHGTKNDLYIKYLIKEYRSMMKYSVKIVLLSNISKIFGDDIEVIVGLPVKNPWSLPYGHKSLFLNNLYSYDIFIYSEDDILITEKNIDHFLNVTKILPGKYIAGFIRYEISKSGEKYYPDFHNRFHWDPNSIFRINNCVFAHHTNEHSACYILTRAQLEKSIESGGFLLPPREGRYDMLVTAATDPYTQCGMKKLICLSDLHGACVHHLPNIYVDKMGLYAEIADREIEKLKILHGKHTVRGPLFETETLLEDSDAPWEKKYYEGVRDDVLSLIPKGAHRVLSVGCSCGSTESELIHRGIEVVGIPMDCVIQVTAEANGIKTVAPNIDAAMESLGGEKFDCILFSDVLQHLDDPASILCKYLNLLGEDGVIIISVPNFHYPSIVRRKMLWKTLLSGVIDGYSFRRYKIHFTSRRLLESWVRKCGMEVIRSSHKVEPGMEHVNRFTRGKFKNILSRNIVVQCRRTQV
jgi:2-polyprenyl-3-methyl-5-hydroxy-6-metoxy-1,4-benzoquinol methylase